MKNFFLSLDSNFWLEIAKKAKSLVGNDKKNLLRVLRRGTKIIHISGRIFPDGLILSIWTVKKNYLVKIPLPIPAFVPDGVENFTINNKNTIICYKND